MDFYELALKDLLSLDAKVLTDIAVAVSLAEVDGTHKIDYDKSIDFQSNLAKLSDVRAYRFVTDILSIYNGVDEVTMSEPVFSSCNIWRTVHRLKPVVLKEAKYKSKDECIEVLKGIYNEFEGNSKLVEYFSGVDCSGLVLSSKYRSVFNRLQGVSFLDTGESPSNSISNWLLARLVSDTENMSICMLFAFKMHNVDLKRKFTINADDSLYNSIKKVKYLSNTLNQYFSYGDADAESVIFLHSLIYKKEAVYEPSRIR